MKHFYKICFLLFFIPFLSNAQDDNSSSTGDVKLYGALGINITTNTPASTSPFYNAGGRPYTSYLPAIFLGMTVPTDPTTGRVLFRLELSAAFSKYTSLYTNKIAPYIPVRASFNSTEIALSPQMIYNFYNAGNFKIYGGIGISVVKSSYSNSYYGPQDVNATFDGNNDYDFRGFDTRLLLKAGIQVHKNVELFFTYLTSSETTNRGFFQLNKNNDHVGLLYIF